MTTAGSFRAAVERSIRAGRPPDASTIRDVAGEHAATLGDEGRADASPARTDSLRVAPPAIACSRSASSTGTTTTTPSEAARATATERSITRTSPSISYCFAVPNRRPVPPPTTIVHICSAWPTCRARSTSSPTPRS